MTKTERFIAAWGLYYMIPVQSKFKEQLHELLKAQRELCADNWCNNESNTEQNIKNTPEP